LNPPSAAETVPVKTDTAAREIKSRQEVVFIVFGLGVTRPILGDKLRTGK
jgi:hypothetical protein